jgi:NADH:ubiquinone oxidoreductase subunit E
VKKVIVCVNRRSNPEQPSCAARGGVALADRLERELSLRGVSVTLERFHCLGRCEDGPNLKLAPGGQFHTHIRPEDVDELLGEIESFVVQAE